MFREQQKIITVSYRGNLIPNMRPQRLSQSRANSLFCQCGCLLLRVFRIGSFVRALSFLFFCAGQWLSKGFSKTIDGFSLFEGKCYRLDAAYDIID